MSVDTAQQQQQQAAESSEHPSYYSQGSIVQLTTEDGRVIDEAEVLFHDPIYRAVIVRYQALSGKTGLYDVAYYQIDCLKQLKLIQLCSNNGIIRQPVIDLQKVEARLRRSQEAATNANAAK